MEQGDTRARNERTAGLRPGGKVEGVLRLPCSKSIAQRALVCADLALGQTRLHGLTWSEDVQAVAGALRALGAEIEEAAASDGAGPSLRVRGRPPGEGARRPAAASSAPGDTDLTEVPLGESGTGARLVTAAVALCGPAGEAFRLRASGTLVRRATPALVAALRAEGAEVTHAADAPWPLRVVPRGAPRRAPDELSLAQPRSSQELSGLLVACAAWPGERRIRVAGPLPSRPYVAMTSAVLAGFGADVVEPERAGGAWSVRGPLRAPSGPYAVEPDASAAAVALAAGCLGGGEVRVPGLTPGSPQGDVRIAEYLRAFGCEASFSADGLRARGAPRHGAELSLEGEPDLAPVLAAVAAAAALRHGEASRLRGLGALRHKESSRVEVLAGALRELGLDARGTDDTLEVRPGPGPSAARRGPAVLDPHDDHRMAFAFALLGLQVPGVHVRSPECVSKSWPGFWDDLVAAGALGLPGV